MEGVILEAETGDFLGKHRGFWFYTIGQRQGLKLSGGPWYTLLLSSPKYSLLVIDSVHRCSSVKACGANY